MPRRQTKPLEIARNFLNGNITAYDIRTNEAYSNRSRGVVVLTVLTHYDTLTFNRFTTPLHPIIEALFPVVFRVDGRCFNNEFPIYHRGELDNRLVSFNPYSISRFLRRANLGKISGNRNTSITLLPPKKLRELVKDHGKQPQTIIDFVRSGKGATELLAQAQAAANK